MSDPEDIEGQVRQIIRDMTLKARRQRRYRKLDDGELLDYIYDEIMRAAERGRFPWEYVIQAYDVARAALEELEDRRERGEEG
jgi:hypothetical protein